MEWSISLLARFTLSLKEAFRRFEWGVKSCCSSFLEKTIRVFLVLLCIMPRAANAGT